jgi:uncharacterized protein (DUF1330 family)
MPSLDPTAETFAALAALPQHEGPVEMINLLRFRAQAAYREGSTHAPCSGAEAYQRYITGIQPFLEGVGGRVVWSGEPELVFIGPPGERWDETFIVRYPDVAAFLRMLTDPGYRAFTVHRTVALEDSRLIVTRGTT